MAVYAAQVDRMDQGLGRVVATLRRLGQLDDTLILFLSDNGGCAELLHEDGWCRNFPAALPDGRHMRSGNRPDLRPGGAETFMSYDLPWANVSNAPFRLYKHWVHEGGISTPLIAHWPKGIADTGRVVHGPCHVVDVLPTLLEACGAAYPSEFGGHAIQGVDGESLTPVFAGADWARQSPIFWEHEGNAAVRAGRFKLVREYGKDWELYDMVEDRTELTDLRHGHGVLADDLAAQWQGWAEAAGVVDWSIVTAGDMGRFGKLDVTGRPLTDDD